MRDQEEECDRLAGVLYAKGLTQEQVSDVFDQIYGQHYSKASISRMVECVRTQVNGWLERGLEAYYPVVFVDCVHIKIHSKRSVAVEAFYVALAVTGEGTREVLGIFNMPQESATGWGVWRWIIRPSTGSCLTLPSTRHYSLTDGKGFLSGTAIPVKLKAPHMERLQDSTVPSFDTATLLAGCSSAEPVFSSGCNPKLLFFHRITK